METDLLKLFRPERLEGETYEEYRIRRITAHKFNKMNAKGVLIWNSAGKNTYVKPPEN